MNKQILGSIFALLSVMSFAFEWWFVRELEFFGLTGFHLLTLLFFTATALFSLGIFSKKIRENFPQKQKKILFIFGVFDVLAFGFFFLAILHIPVIQVLLWVGLSSFYTLIASHIFLDEKFSVKNLLGIFLGFTGMAVYLLFGSDGEIFSSLSIGDLYAFLCGASMGAVYTIGSKMKKHPVYWKTFFTWLPGAIGFPFLFYFFPPVIPEFSAQHFFSQEFLLLFSGILITSIFLAMIFFQLSMKYTSVTKISTIRLTEPLWQGVTAFFIAHESLSFFQLLGVILLFLGIWRVQKN